MHIRTHSKHINSNLIFHHQQAPRDHTSPVNFEPSIRICRQRSWCDRVRSALGRHFDAFSTLTWALFEEPAASFDDFFTWRGDGAPAAARELRPRSKRPYLAVRRAASSEFLCPARSRKIATGRSDTCHNYLHHGRPLQTVCGQSRLAALTTDDPSAA